MATATTGNVTLTLASRGACTTSVASTAGTIAITGAATGSLWDSSIAKTTAKGQMHLNGEDADLVINGKSLNKTLDAINSRLAILQPKPELLAKYEALQQAYDHYKTLEALLHEDDSGNK